jgi:hypothetical protein
VEPFCARFRYPKWELAEGLDAGDLKGKWKKKDTGQTKAQQAAEDNVKIEQVLESIRQPMTQAEILSRGEELGIKHWNRDVVRELVKTWQKQKRATEVQEHAGQQPAMYIRTDIAAMAPLQQETDKTNDVGQLEQGGSSA